MARWRDVFFIKNSLKIPTLSSSSSVASFHSTAPSCEKWKNKWNADVNRAQQPTKNYVRYQIRQKRADTKRAINNLVFGNGSSKISFQYDNPIWKFGEKNRWCDKSDTKCQLKSSSRSFGKSDRKRMKRKSRRRDSFSEDVEDLDSTFQGRFGNRWYTWTYQSLKDSSFQSSAFGFQWRVNSNRTNHKTKDWESAREVESDDELLTVGSCSDRTMLGLPPRGPLKIEDVKTAFRSSALKWHPDKHQGPSQAMAEEKFKLCVNAYKSLCDALSCVEA